ncbi:hypothetical protein H0H92_003975 [Tricholoma furcatifolium]|nr:hypothetical protein H0H92_003975 [Tricholoma furcatifolium]
MPSLRRTISSPSVRSSPYSSALSAGHPSRPGGHRRSSGSETSTRRVLADIEWWRVVDGQRDLDADQEPVPSSDQAPDSPSSLALAMEELLGSSMLFSAGMGVEHSAIVPLAVGSLQSSQTPPTTQFAALSIGPQTPIRRNHARNSSQSSLESTPEAVQPAMFDGLRLAIRDTELGISDPLPNFPVLQRSSSASLGSAPPLFAVSDFLAFENNSANHYADFSVSPLSAAADLFN